VGALPLTAVRESSQLPRRRTKEGILPKSSLGGGGYRWGREILKIRI